ncbi:MAG: hypothetical protein FJ284_11895, partial [Planctomycetes bacterium]|nr:hypothetical protein [Planctomycetota bacterium]
MSSPPACGRAALVAYALAVAGWAAAVRAADAVEVLPPEASAGVLASLPARGLAAAIAEAGKIEVPAVEPGERLVVEATQAARWTEGAYDVWHLTGGIRIVQGGTEARAHEAVAWVERPDERRPAAGTQVRSMLVRMAGDVTVRSRDAQAEAAASVRGDRWTGRFWHLHDPVLDFASVAPSAGRPPLYEAPADGG